MYTTFRNNSSFPPRVSKFPTTGRTALCVTLDMTDAERFKYVHLSHIAFQTASGAVIHNTLLHYLRIHLMQLRYFAATLRTTGSLPSHIPYVLIRYGASRQYGHPYNSAQCVLSGMTHKQ